MAGMADTLVVPDLVVWTVWMTDLDPQLGAAKSSNDAKLAALLEAIGKIAIVPGSLRTGPARIERRFRRCDDGVDRFSHFSVRRQVTFHQDDPEAVDGALDLMVNAADIEVWCLFDLADPETIMRELRARAIDRARDKAASLAAHLGKAAGEIVGLNVQEDVNPYRRQRYAQDPNGDVSGPQARYLHTEVRVTLATD